ncbi:MAG: sulfatase [Thermoanaerobaculia bacterium]
MLLRSGAARFAAGAYMLLAAGACADNRPSVLLVVEDTVRADAVSAYGAVEGTTPFFDDLAAHGTLYRHAYSAAPWTAPSHASLFTGREPLDHGVGVRRWTLPVELPTLAERFAAIGYETVGFSENPLAGPLTGLARGFQTFGEEAVDGSSVAASLDRWLAGREGRRRPFFLFVNLIGAHAPHPSREPNRFVPPTSASAIADLPQQVIPEPLCHRPLSPAALAALRGLYLGDVAVVDAQLAKVVGQARAAAGERRLLTVVTSDHGEQFGERGQMGHLFGVAPSLLHVPLVVHGLGAQAGREVAAPVALTGLGASLLAWVGDRAPFGVASSWLEAPPGAERALRVPWVELDRLAGTTDRPLFAEIESQAREIREGCDDSDGLFGDRTAALAFPYQLIVSAHAGAELYDVERDPAGEHDLARERPELVARLLRTLENDPESPRDAD